MEYRPFYFYRGYLELTQKLPEEYSNEFLTEQREPTPLPTQHWRRPFSRSRPVLMHQQDGTKNAANTEKEAVVRGKSIGMW